MEIHRIIPTYKWHPKKLPYLRILSVEGARSIARLRCSAHNFIIEREGHLRMRRQQRFCHVRSLQPELSCAYTVETKHHVVNCCPDHAEVRRCFYREVFAIDLSLASHSEKQLLGLMLNPKKEWAAVVGCFLKQVMSKVDLRYLVPEGQTN